MNWRKTTFVTVALITLLGGSAALSELFISLKPEPPRRPDEDLKRFVKTEVVDYGELESPVFARGRVVSGNEVTLVSEAAGKIEQGQVSLKKGTSFKKGQLLAVIYKDEVELALKARKSTFLNSLTNILPDMKIDFPDSYDVFLNFFNEIGLNESLPELPATENEKLKIFLASRNILSDYYGIKQDEKKLARHSLYAPFEGTFTQVNSEVGAYVNSGSQIAKMISTGKLEVEVPVENSFSKWIRIGDPVDLYSPEGQVEMKGRVARKADFVDMNTQSRSIFVQVVNTGGKELLSGEYKQVEFPGHLISDVMEMPRGAVFNSNEVFTVVDGKLKKEEIDIVKVNETTIIFNGISEGVHLVVEPLINVKENSPVSIFSAEEGNQSPGNKQKQVKTQLGR
ncbi:efflux RND transporter periplasmic adaptor subunit [Sunxiuqinia sp. A32]|uniref:efflux RND transporter periplasmic adaptor subunit n=1 Tax=Sunxiuqinia sp. A32 TaxID=3461496 RepID=UPI0040459707